jgi:PIN domain nuclease of toxin-antitoxin system
MRLLLDTHAFLWFVLNDHALSQVARELMIDPQNVLLVSPASYWEIAIKISIGKYQVPEPFESWMRRQIQVNDLEILPIDISYTAAVITLPFHHKDPFDRLLIALSKPEQIPMISADGAMDAYSVTRYW